MTPDERKDYLRFVNSELNSFFESPSEEEYERTAKKVERFKKERARRLTNYISMAFTLFFGGSNELDDGFDSERKYYCHSLMNVLGVSKFFREEDFSDKSKWVKT